MDELEELFSGTRATISTSTPPSANEEPKPAPETTEELPLEPETVISSLPGDLTENLVVGGKVETKKGKRKKPYDKDKPKKPRKNAKRRRFRRRVCCRSITTS